jgi:iron complex outermembrane receptor protein
VLQEAYGRRVLAILALVLITTPTVAFAVTVSGRVIDSHTGRALSHATIRLVESGRTVMSDSAGNFSLSDVAPGRYAVTASYVGYKPAQLNVVLDGDASQIELLLDPTVLPGEEVTITTTRVSAQTDAVSHSNITREEIQRDYTVEDVPMFLAKQPGAYAYSDAGNGVGYSYLQIRGFDQRKISVLVNGVPHNDPESHQVYWVDVPDLMESASDVQVQRGVGASLYGASAAGGVVSMEVNPFGEKPSLAVDFGYGSFGTRKFKLEGKSGLIQNRYSVYGRFSRIVSDGYREQSWVDMWSYFIGFARYDGRLVNRFHAYGGPERLHLAYLGIDPPTLATNRRFNPLEYENETDTFNQPHYELLTDWQISEKLSLANTLFYIKGDGFFVQSWPWSSFGDLGLNAIQTRDSAAFDPIHYETVVTDTQFVQNPGTFGDTLWHQVENSTFRRDTLPSGDTVFTVNQFNNAILQRWVENRFMGIAPRFKYEHAGGLLQFGGSFDYHFGSHFGEVRSADPAPAGFQSGQRFYSYDGYRTSGILFAQESRTIASRLHLTLGLQFAWRRYSLRNDSQGGVSYDLDFTTLSPRLGMLYKLTPIHALYANLSYGAHEPAHTDIFRPEESENPTRFFRLFDPSTGRASDPFMGAERVTSLDLGYRLRDEGIQIDFNGFYMWFDNEIVAAGGIDKDGNPIRTNAGRTIHRGIEALVKYRLTKQLEVSANGTWSDNYFEEFTQYFATPESPQSNDTVFLPVATPDSVSFAGNSISGFPETAVNLGVHLNVPLAKGGTRLLAGVEYRYVGRIFLDNSSAVDFSIEPYQVVNLRAGMQFAGRSVFKSLAIELLVNNVADEQFSASGYTFLGVPYVYPAAERNFYLRLRTRW